jgi:integration host factor subunit beta
VEVVVAFSAGRETVTFEATCINPLKFEKVIELSPLATDMRAENNRMTKADLIDEVSRLAELTRKDSEVIVETIFDSVVRSLRAGDKIEIRGFGSFRTRQRRPRVGRNPKTGERVEVPAKKIPFFKPSKELKDLVNEGDGAVAQPPFSVPPTLPQ